MTHPFWVSEADATFSDQSEPDPLDAEILLLGFRQTGVVSGCDVTQSSGSEMEIDVASGEVLIAGASTTVSAQPDRTIATADGTNPRFDLVTINSSGTVVVTTGTPAVQPVSPDMPDATSVPLAYVYVPASDTTITDNQIHDKRVLLVASAGASTMYAENSGEDFVVSTSAFPWKGSSVTPNVDIDIHGLVFIGTVISGGDYQGAVITESGGTVATITKSEEVTATALDAEVAEGKMLVQFATPITLSADTTYYLLMGRTDAGDTYSLPSQFPNAEFAFPFGGMVANQSSRIAKQNPAVSDTISFSTPGVVRMGVLWSIV